jgi:hypothetical protein
MFDVMFEGSSAKLVSQQVRCDIVTYCDNQMLFNYLVILEANHNPYTV